MTPSPRYLLILLAGFSLSLWLSFLFFKSNPSPHPLITPLSSWVVPTLTPTPDPLKSFSILILGYAGPGHDGGSLSDTMILADINPHLKRISLISLPRDLWVDLPLNASGSSAKINHTYAIGNDDRQYPHKPVTYTGKFGGLNLAKAVVQTVTGIPVDYALAVNFDGFTRIINLFGGVKVNVPYTFDDPWYPLDNHQTDTCGFTPEDVATLSAALKGDELEHQFTCRYETLHFDKGNTTMDATTALKFVRSRHSDVGGGDFGRNLRQQALLQGLKNQALSLSTLSKLPSLIQTIMSSLNADFDINLIKPILALPVKPQDFTLQTVTLDQNNLLKPATSPDGQYILVPTDPIGFYTLHQFLTQKLNEVAIASPTPTLKPL